MNMKSKEDIVQMKEKLITDLARERTQRMKNQIIGNIDALKWVLSE